MPPAWLVDRYHTVLAPGAISGVMARINDLLSPPHLRKARIRCDSNGIPWKGRGRRLRRSQGHQREDEGRGAWKLQGGVTGRAGCGESGRGGCEVLAGLINAGPSGLVGEGPQKRREL